MNRFCSIFSQLLQLFPRTKFQEVVKKTKAERHARDLFAGVNLCPCCSASWGEPIRLEKLLAV